MTPTATPSSTEPPIVRLACWGGLILQVLIGLFPLGASGLLAPPWALGVVAVAWAAGVWVAWRLARTRPARTPVVPVVTVAAWYLFMTAGDLWLGWTA